MSLIGKPAGGFGICFSRSSLTGYRLSSIGKDNRLMSFGKGTRPFVTRGCVVSGAIEKVPNEAIKLPPSVQLYG